MLRLSYGMYTPWHPYPSSLYTGEAYTVERFTVYSLVHRREVKWLPIQGITPRESSSFKCVSDWIRPLANRYSADPNTHTIIRENIYIYIVHIVWWVRTWFNAPTYRGWRFRAICQMACVLGILLNMWEFFS